MSDEGLLGRRTEGETLDRLLTQARSGSGQVLVLRGEAGIGKTALLDHVSARAVGLPGHAGGGRRVRERVRRTRGCTSCACRSSTGSTEAAASRSARRSATAFGMASGPRPTRFMVGLAVLTLLAEVADEQPLVCLVDDAQWLDSMSSAVLGFVARRLLAERIALVFVLREGNDYLDGLPELFVRGLDDADARALLDSVIKGPVDGRVRDRIVAETRGNPLALLELPRAWTTAELADGLDGGPLTSRIEAGFVRQIAPLPADTRLLLLIAAAEPLGDATLLWQAAGLLGLGADPAAAARATGLIEFGARVRFRHPLVRSAVYRSASTVDRMRVHRALADVTDPAIDPDRRAWHRAQGTDRAGRGGRRRRWSTRPAAPRPVAGCSPRPRSSSRRRCSHPNPAAGALRVSSRRRGPNVTRARWTRRCGCCQRSRPGRRTSAAAPRSSTCAGTSRSTSAGSPTPRRCCSAPPAGSRRSTPTWPAKRTWKALSAAIWAGAPLADAARTAPPPRDPGRARWTWCSTLSRPASPRATRRPFRIMARALDALRALKVGADDISRVPWLFGNRAGGIVASELWDFDTRRAFAQQQVRLSRDTGALVQLQFALNFLADNELLAGEPAAAQALIEEDRRDLRGHRHPAGRLRGTAAGRLPRRGPGHGGVDGRARSRARDGWPSSPTGPPRSSTTDSAATTSPATPRCGCSRPTPSSTAA